MAAKKRSAPRGALWMVASALLACAEAAPKEELPLAPQGDIVPGVTAINLPTMTAICAGASPAQHHVRADLALSFAEPREPTLSEREQYGIRDEFLTFLSEQRSDSWRQAEGRREIREGLTESAVRVLGDNCNNVFIVAWKVE